jgi:D-amino-acid dehydrogenase
MTATKPKTIAVIGAGIIGVTTARALQKQGFEVLLFDADKPGMGTSYGNAGYIATDEIIPLSHGISLGAILKMLANPLAPLSIRWQQIFHLLPWFQKFWAYSRPEKALEGALAMAALQKTARPAWDALAREEKLSQKIRHNGAAIVFETEHGFKAESPKLPFYEEHGVVFDVLEGNEAHKIIPELSKSVQKAIFYKDGAHVTNPLEIVQLVFDNFTRDGGTFVQQKVTGLLLDDDHCLGVKTEAQPFEVNAVVVAAGHLSGTIFRDLGTKVPLVAERGYHVVHDHKPLGFDMALGSHERGFFITPMAEGLRLAGTVEFAPAHKTIAPNWKRADILSRHVQELLPGVLEGEKSRWMGHRPTLPDFLPAIGQSEVCRNLYYNFGHQHLGLTLAPASANLVSDLISTGKSPIDLSPYDLARF